MVLEFNLKTMDQEERALIPDFLDYLLQIIRTDIKNNLIPNKLLMREQDLIDAKWIKWRRKPTKLNMIKIGNLIVNNIFWYQRRFDTYVVQIRKGTLLPNSFTNLHLVARFLDKGNNKVPPTWFISKTLFKVRKNIKDYWMTFIQIELHKYSDITDIIRII